MFTSCFTIREQEHRQWTPCKHGGAIGFAEHCVCHARAALRFTQSRNLRAAPPDSGERGDAKKCAVKSKRSFILRLARRWPGSQACFAKSLRPVTLLETNLPTNSR
jgi:hypothetical protein